MEKLQAILRLMESDEYLLVTTSKEKEEIFFNRDMSNTNVKRYFKQVYDYVRNSEKTLKAFKKLL
ncbi:hypothetical protein [Pontibacter liquoris]|uniref:hypothetical protein n=1 Tax=Pontibacter liquoris TaxID=2905677 RepID=UPI001FA7AFFA|nr:hypothetical protein [Pontibacter liquoris]